MVGLALLRGLPGLGEVINNLSSWLVWQISFFIAFPWHRVCPRWVFGLFSAFCVSGFLAAGRISSSNWRCGSPQYWGVTENLPPFFSLIFGLIFILFYFVLVCLGFCFSSQVGRTRSQENKMATLGHFVPTPPFQGAGAGSAPAPGG